MKLPINKSLCSAGVMLVAAMALSSCKPSNPFAKADTNKDDKVSQTEFNRYILEEIYSAADSDGNSKITFKEWKAANPDVKKSKFKLPDDNSDGAVTPQELQKYYEEEGKLTDLFKQIDSNKDGFLSHPEVDAYMSKVESKAAKSTKSKKP